MTIKTLPSLEDQITLSCDEFLLFFEEEQGRTFSLDDLEFAFKTGARIGAEFHYLIKRDKNSPPV